MKLKPTLLAHLLHISFIVGVEPASNCIFLNRHSHFVTGIKYTKVHIDRMDSVKVSFNVQPLKLLAYT